MHIESRPFSYSQLAYIYPPYPNHKQSPPTKPSPLRTVAPPPTSAAGSRARDPSAKQAATLIRSMASTTIPATSAWKRLGLAMSTGADDDGGADARAEQRRPPMTNSPEPASRENSVLDAVVGNRKMRAVAQGRARRAMPTPQRTTARDRSTRADIVSVEAV